MNTFWNSLQQFPSEPLSTMRLSNVLLATGLGHAMARSLAGFSHHPNALAPRDLELEGAVRALYARTTAADAYDADDDNFDLFTRDAEPDEAIRALVRRMFRGSGKTVLEAANTANTVYQKYQDNKDQQAQSKPPPQQYTQQQMGKYDQLAKQNSQSQQTFQSKPSTKIEPIKYPLGVQPPTGKKGKN